MASINGYPMFLGSSIEDLVSDDKGVSLIVKERFPALLATSSDKCSIATAPPQEATDTFHPFLCTLEKQCFAAAKQHHLQLMEAMSLMDNPFLSDIVPDKSIMLRR